MRTGFAYETVTTGKL